MLKMAKPGGYLTKEETRYARNPDFIYRKIVDEAVLVPIHKDVADMECIYTLNELGAFIWERLEEPTTQGELQAVVLEAYDAETQALVADLTRFLEEMTGIGAVRKV
jgi:hypothetical protein